MLNDRYRLEVEWYDHRIDTVYHADLLWDGAEHNIRSVEHNMTLRRLEDIELYNLPLHMQATVGDWLDMWGLWD